MNLLSISPRFINPSLSNAVLNYDVVTCITGNEDIKSGRSFNVLGADQETLHVMLGDKQIGVCHSTMSWRNGGSTAYFKPRVILESIDTLTINDVGVVIIGKRYGNGSANDFYIEDATITINDIDMKISFEGSMLPAGGTTYHHTNIVVTNIIGVHPLLEVIPVIEQKILDAIMADYRQLVAKLNPFLREQVLTHIYMTKPKYRLNQYDIASLTPKLAAIDQLKELSEQEISKGCQIVINHYDDYMPAFIDSRKQINDKE